ncbi:MAG: hypothetical protein HDQ88_01335 [Clostridia bacterium]|nr:hypothetical protein [Clostridia bacterium]
MDGDCGSLKRAYDSTVGAGVNPTEKAIEADISQPDNKKAFEEARQEEQRKATIDELKNENTDASPSIETPTAGDERSARATARGISKIIKQIAGEGLQKRYDDFIDALELAAQTGIMQTTKWMNLQNTLFTNWVDERGAFHAFIRSVANLPGVQAFMHPINRQFEQMFPKLQALTQTYNAKLRDIVKSVADIERATGVDAEDIAIRLGDWCNAHHIVKDDVNGILISKWREEAENIRQNMSEADSVSTREKKEMEARRYEDQADILEERLDDIAPEEGLVSAGYTNAEARKLMADIEREFNITPERAEAFHKLVTKFADDIMSDRALAGSIESGTAANIPAFLAYSPLISRHENMSGANNDIAIYNPGSYYARQGRTEHPDSALMTLGFLARRAANEQATRDLGISLAALNRQRLKEIRDSIQSGAKGADIDTRTLNAMAQKRLTEELGIKSLSYRQLMQQARSRDWQAREKAMSILNNNGIVIDVPVKSNDGTIALQRRYMWFDDNYQLPNTKVTGRDLNKALTSNYKLGGGAEFLTKLTSYMGQANTRFQPLFAPIAGLRNLMETAFHMLNRDAYTESGERIGGGTLAGKYLLNTYTAGKILAQGMLGKLDPNTPAGRMWEEYKRSGVHQEYTPGIIQKNTGLDSKMPEWLTKDPHTGELQKYLSRIGDIGKDIVGKLDTLNNWFQSVAAFNQFMTLRKAGVSADNAAQSALELMNMSQTGKLSRYLRIVAPFVNPTMQSTAAYARTLGLGATTPGEILSAGARGWGAMVVGGVSFSVLTPVLREMWGKDENGRYYYDRLSVSQATSSLNIGREDGGYSRIPLGYGPIRTAAVFGHVTDKVLRGLMDVPDAAFELLFSTFKDTIPGNFPGYGPNKHPLQWAATVVTPEPLRPILEVATGTNFFGSRISSVSDRTDKARADQGRTSTPPMWHQFAASVTRAGGPDLAPEEWRELTKSLYIGPGKLFISFFQRIMEEGQLRKNGNNKTALEEMNPILGAIGGTLFYGKVRNPTQSLFFEVAEEYDERIRQAGIKLSDPANKGKPEETREFRRRQLEDSGAFTQNEIDDIMVIQEARTQISNQGKAFNAEYRERWKAMEDSTELREAFVDLYDQNQEVYVWATDQLNHAKAQR